MQIQCSHCESRYKIDPDKLPKGASFVRCTNCQKPIYLKRPDQGETDRVLADCPKCRTQYAIPQAHFANGPVTAHCKKCDYLFQIDAQGKTSHLATTPEPGKPAAAKPVAKPQPAPMPEPEQEELDLDAGELGALDDADLGDADDFAENLEEDDLGSLDDGDLEGGHPLDHDLEADDLGSLDDGDLEGDHPLDQDLEDDDLGSLDDAELGFGDEGLDEVEIHDETDLGDGELDFEDEFDHEADLGDLGEDDFSSSAAGADEEYADSVTLDETDDFGLEEEITPQEKGMFLGAETKSKAAPPQPAAAKAKATAKTKTPEPAKSKTKAPVAAKKGGKLKWVAMLMLVLGAGGFWAWDQGLLLPGGTPASISPPVARDPNAPKISIIGELDGKMIHNQSLGHNIFVLQGSVKNLHRSDEIIRMVKIQGELFDSQQRLVASNMGYAGMIMANSELSTFSEAELKAQATDLAKISEIQLGAGMNRHMTFQIIFLNPPTEIHGLQAKILSYQKNGEAREVER